MEFTEGNIDWWTPVQESEPIQLMINELEKNLLRDLSNLMTTLVTNVTTEQQNKFISKLDDYLETKKSEYTDNKPKWATQLKTDVKNALKNHIIEIGNNNGEMLNAMQQININIQKQKAEIEEAKYMATEAMRISKDGGETIYE